MADSTGESRSAAPRATWHELYEAAMLELDNAKLARRILGARHAISIGHSKSCPLRLATKVGP